MSRYKIITDDNTQEFDDQEQFENIKDLLDEKGREYEVETPETRADGMGETVDAEVVEHTDGSAEPAEPTTAVEKNESEEIAVDESDLDAIDQLGDSLGTDPLDILPEHMVDTIQGQPAVNKRGYAMIAERYGIEVSADIEVYPWENEEGRCVARATAVTEDGREYSGWATASADDGDMNDQIIELAETRALKRGVSWASGVGIVSYQEMAGELE